MIVKGADDEIWRNSHLYSKYRWLEIADSAKDTHIVVRHNEKRYGLVSNEEEYVMRPDMGWGFESVYPEKDNRGRPIVGFKFDRKGSELFYKLTSSNIGNTLAIIIDGKIVAAPQIQLAIRNQGVITGIFSEQEVAKMVAALQKGMSQKNTSLL